MPYIFKHRRAPEPWKKYRLSVRYKLLVPLLFVEWAAEWTAYVLSQLSILEVLEYAGSLSILLGVISYFAGAEDRLQQKHYQAWQVINTAQGKGGNGGRIDALEQLNADHIALVGIDVSGAFLMDVKLPDAALDRSNMRAADMRGANLSRAGLEESTLISTNLRGANLSGARLAGSDMTDADCNGAILSGVDLMKATMDKADLRTADLTGLANWKSIQSMRLANIAGVKNAPEGFVDWAKSQGAVEASDEEWDKLLRK
jgi:hypothetical protein